MKQQSMRSRQDKLVHGPRAAAFFISASLACALLASCQSGALGLLSGGQSAPPATQPATPTTPAAATPATAQEQNSKGSISASADGSTADPVIETDTWLRNPVYAQNFTGQDQPPAIDFTGVSRQANANAVLQVSDLTQIGEVWQTIATGTTSGQATTLKQEQLYPFTFKNVGLSRAQWPKGGVVRVRVMVGTNPSVSFDGRSDVCQALTKTATWTDFAKTCASNRPFVTLVDDAGNAPVGNILFLLPPDGNQAIVSSVSQNETQRYLKATGLLDRAATLADFQQRYRLAGPGSRNANGSNNETNAIYYNFGDLGFGREMHCNKADNGDIGCAVTNYGQPGGDATVALNLAQQQSNPIATVAMEYRATAISDPITFMVYDGQGNPLTQATLDSQGNKPTPLICLSCHGGKYDAVNHSVTGTNFLPFDTDELQYANTKGLTLNDQQDKFRQLNSYVAQTAPSTAIGGLIAGWYGNIGVATPGAKLDPTFVPDGWKDQTDLYINVVKPYCRSCHNSLQSNLSWPTSKDFIALSATIQRDVCTAAVMPRSEETMVHFFQSGARAGLLDALKLQTACNPK